MIIKKFSHTITLLLLLVCCSCGITAIAATPVSFLANVKPDSSQTVFNIQLGSDQIATDQLNNMLRPEGGRVLRVTSIEGFLSDGLALPESPDYALLFLGAVTRTEAIRGLGTGTLVLTGISTSQINYDPGLLVSLLPNESLVLRSQIQSNHAARIEVHGFLESQP